MWSTVNKLINNNPRLKAIEERIQQEERTKQRTVLDQNHPNWEITAGTPEFQNWVGENQARSRMFQEAHVNYDFELANELFNMYTAGKSQQVSEPAAQKQEVVKQAVETGSTGSAPTKVYRRADLLNLRISDPAKYEAMEDDIMLAYAQGRVR